MKLHRTAWVLLVALAMAGCQTVGTRVSTHLESDPPGGEVYLLGTRDWTRAGGEALLTDPEKLALYRKGFTPLDQTVGMHPHIYIVKMNDRILWQKIDPALNSSNHFSIKFP